MYTFLVIFSTGARTISAHTIEKSLGLYFGADWVQSDGFEPGGAARFVISAEIDFFLSFLNLDLWKIYGQAVSIKAFDHEFKFPND